MLQLKKILLPVDYPVATFSVIHQAAMLARHFQSELVLLHAVTARSHKAGVPVEGRELLGWDLLGAILKQAQKEKQESVEPALDGLTIQFKLATGDAANAIVQTAAELKVDLIMMPSHSFTFYQFLMGAVAARVLNGTECPVWTGAHVEAAPAQPFAIRNVLCGVDLGPRSDKAVSWASQIATEFGAKLTLAHVTAGMDIFGPGGWHDDAKWKASLVRDASRRMTELERDTGIKADVFIGSGDVPKVLSEVAKQTKADLLVTGCYPYGGNLRTHGYAIICAVPIPVLSV
jgi:nucleotide-binding universal stress UspA family protein